MEDATLSELASIAIEILEKNALQPGSVLLFGSISHLFKVGAGSYVAEWIQLLMKIETKFKNINVCPLVPVISDVTSGMVVRDLELISTWFHKVYANNIKGLLDTWAAVTHYAQQSGSGAVPSTNDEIQKIPMPANMVTPLLVPTYFKFCNSAPAILTGMSSLVTSELLRILLSALHQNFSVAVGTEVILESVAMAEGDVKVTKHLVCIGSSIVKQLIPSLQAAGYTITDLSQPGWLATEENIQLLIKKMSELQLHQPFSVVMDLFSNCSHRFENFDGTQSLPFKDGSKYHMLGPVVACNEDTFRKIIKSLAPVLLSAQSIKKILIPPLPRYLITPCCNTATHCTNILRDGYMEKALSGLTKLRGLIKKECIGMGVLNFWVMDGVGALLGTPPGECHGSTNEIIPELRGKLASDGVHIDPAGNRNLAKNISETMEKMQNKGTGISDFSPLAGNKKAEKFYWWGFSSPVGDSLGRASAAHCSKAPKGWHSNRRGQLPYDRSGR
jgi:hypothetical protein